ncbi:MAG: LysR family transcriptional regulator [Cellulomonadaceae bacterium]|jgi:DNA-binding transcriptional LysR family regulator|nr:LysR family transcriptional regulator [Cellulomonadaceae bacterium]
MATDTRRLTFLLAVYRAGGVLAAAELLGVTPSAVSQQISRLEAEEGFPVLERGPRGVTLTAPGKILAEAAERIEAELVSANQAIASLGDGVAGKVSIGGFQTVIRAVIAPALPRLRDSYPGIELDVQEREPEVAHRMLRSGDLDIVVVERDADTRGTPHKGLAEIPLLDEPWRLIIPASHPVPQRLSDVAHLTFVNGEEGTAADRALRRLEYQLGCAIDRRHSTFDFDTTITLVSAGQGVALVPALALEGRLHAPINAVRLTGLGARRLYARHRSGRHEPSAAVMAVIDQMVVIADDLDLR